MKKINHVCFSIPCARGVKRKRRFNIGAYQQAKKIGMQNAQAEQIKAVKELANRVEKETELDKITKKLRATTMKVERRKRKVRVFFF